MPQIRDHSPIKQGLRQFHFHRAVLEGYFRLRDHSPIEQGLRPFGLLAISMQIKRLRDHSPIEQGLRLDSFTLW